MPLALVLPSSSITDNISGSHLSRVKERTFEMCTPKKEASQKTLRFNHYAPRPRCMPEHSMHNVTPYVIEVQVGSTLMKKKR